MKRLHRELIKSYKFKTIVNAPTTDGLIKNGLIATAPDILKQDLTNFLLDILFAAILLT
jgi:hypothetical protein